ncbi:MAG: DUF3854 domain-containing protein, partial [Planctomycetota bacterium]
MIFAYRNLSGATNGFLRKRPHDPRVIDGKPVKYEQAKGSIPHAYFPAGCLKQLRAGTGPVYVTEGEKKSLALAQMGFTAIGLGGVWAWKIKGTDTLIPDLQGIGWQGQTVYVVFDHDKEQTTRIKVRLAEGRFGKALAAAGAKFVSRVTLPARPGGAKQGVDDYLLAHGREAFVKLVESATLLEDSEKPDVVPIPLGELVTRYPDLRTPIIHGIARAGETINAIAPSKAGKSWLAWALALSIALGKKWLGRFAVERGRVLIVDNELHPETIAWRGKTVAQAMGLKPEGIDVLP